MIAQNNLFSQFNIKTGTTWQGDWPPGRIESNRRIYDYEFIYFSRGRGRIITEDKSYLCSKGTVVIIPPKLIHCTIAESEVSRWCIHFDWFGNCPAHQDKRPIFVYLDGKTEFDFDYAAKEFPEEILSFPLCLQLNEKKQQEIMPVLRNFFRATPGNFGTELCRNGFFLQIMGMILDTSSVQISNHYSNDRFFKAKSILDECASDSRLEIKDVAAELRLSPNHLTKLFRRTLGMTPLSYLQNRRLALAEELLCQSEFTIREIAFSCGYNDANYFARFFRSKHGISPSEFRAKESSSD